jgi:hydrogenase nickel incorporation protein HypB
MTSKKITVKRDIRAEQLAAANAFRDRMTQQGTLVVRLISSPGAGKTMLLEKTAAMLGESKPIAVLVGDVETDRDAQRLSRFAPTIQITTGGACHLEIPLVERAFLQLGDSRLDFLFIEDVGNLICPASHDLGEHLRVLLLSTTEGDDKPGKYPKAFRTSDVLVLSKTDLLPFVPFSLKDAEHDARRIQPALKIVALSAQSGDGVAEWCELLGRERRRLLTAVDADVPNDCVPGLGQLAHSGNKADASRGHTKLTNPSKSTRKSSAT